jgi:hypothetical protein
VRSRLLEGLRAHADQAVEGWREPG